MKYDPNDLQQCIQVCVQKEVAALSARHDTVLEASCTPVWYIDHAADVTVSLVWLKPTDPGAPLNRILAEDKADRFYQTIRFANVHWFRAERYHDQDAIMRLAEDIVEAFEDLDAWMNERLAANA